MKKTIFATLLVFALVISACGNNEIKPKKAGEALAEITCLTLTMDLEGESSPTMDETAQKYGFESYTQIMEHLTENAGTTDFNEISVALRTNLEEMCGPALEDFGFSAAEMAESIMAVQ
jgi:hypothetical protein